MLSYQHAYHAGGFADLVKHLTLTRLLDYMVQKDKPMIYIDTHAGKGLYDLEDTKAKTTHEADFGIKRLWKERQHLPDVFKRYLSTIAACNDGDEVRVYPGSPTFAIHALRSTDQLFFSELHPKEYEHLKSCPQHNLKVTCHHGDGMKHLQALLPPKARRGLIMCDPSYEVKTEYRDCPPKLKEAYTRFPTGVYCIWYPLVNETWHQQLFDGLLAIGAKKNLRFEFSQTTPTGKSTTGCGLWVINAPFVLFNELRLIADTLQPLFPTSYLLESYDHYSTGSPG